MATETVPGATLTAVDSPSDWELMNQAEHALNNACMRANAVLAIFDRGDFYDMASAKGDEAYALMSAAECLLKDLATVARAAMDARVAAISAKRAGVSHG